MSASALPKRRAASITANGEPRGIYGEASEAEAEALADDGIDVARIPWVPSSDA